MPPLWHFIPLQKNKGNGLISIKKHKKTSSANIYSLNAS